jgi:hypothetical protein
VLSYWEGSGLLQLLTSLLLLGGFGVRIGDLRQLRYLTVWGAARGWDRRGDDCAGSDGLDHTTIERMSEIV